MKKVLRRGLTFYINLGRNERAEIINEKINDKLYVMSSFTPPKHRGKGIASIIMNEVIKYARKNKLRIIPKCAFARKYCKEHKC